ncbi:MAG: glucose-6-phosphate isomerase family protein [Thermoproteota archaeon]|jgi:glucose-6-phosphate isomerase|nr:glucose-6-phosphate isomerase family protein [Thermoproteota archaeon]
MKIDINLNVYDENNYSELYFENIKYEPSIKRLEDLIDVFYDFENLDKNIILYYVYRNLNNEESRAYTELYQLRFDVTVLPPIEIGKEKNKTHGHYHPEAAPGRAFPEIYQILKGEALFILQNIEGDEVKSVLLIRGKERELIMIPPNYGHNMINIGKDVLITMNLVSNRFLPLYELYKIKKGSCLYFLKNNKLIKNKNYAKIIEIKMLKPKINYINIFTDFIKDPEKYLFLNRPYLKHNNYYFKEFYEEIPMEGFVLEES